MEHGHGRALRSTRIVHLLVSTVRLLVHANIIIATAAVGVALTTIAIGALPLEPFPLAFVFSATFLAYTQNRHFDQEEDLTNLPKRTSFYETYGTMVVLAALIAYGSAAYVMVVWYRHLTPLLLAPPLAAWVYSRGPVKSMFLVKNLFVGVLWATIPFGLGIYYGHLLAPRIMLLTLFVLVLFTIAAVVFDIKDLVGDEKADIFTVPVTYGVTQTKRIALAASVLLLPIIALGMAYLTERYVILTIYVVHLLLVVPFASSDRGPLYYGFVIDGEHILVGGLAGAIWLL